MPSHILGQRLNGVLCRYTRILSDEEFEPLTQLGLPRGWVAWHISEGEHIHNSPKVQALSKIPVIANNTEKYPWLPSYPDPITLIVAFEGDQYQKLANTCSWR